MPRKHAFSGKQKKKQLQERREKKKDSCGIYDEELVQEVSEDAAKGEGEGQAEVLHVHEQPAVGKDFDPNRYRLHFLKISQEEMKKRKTAARKPVVKGTEKDLEMSIESIYPAESALDFPKRPPWDFRLSKKQLEGQEQAYYSKYVQTLLTSHNAQQLSYFELNLETWRQLWRVMEISDILLLIADIRYPAVHLSPGLYRYLREELGREVVVVLNKVDLAQPHLVAAWRSYLTSVFPEATVVCFSSFPASAGPAEQGAGLGLHRKQKKKSVKPMGPQELLDVCRELVKDKVNLDSWQEKLDADDCSTSAPVQHGCHGEVDDAGKVAGGHSHPGTADSQFAGVYQRFRDSILTIGCIGFPNVGKSSLLNGLVGKKVVSVSRTPGHTKHLQTIFLTPTVKLCDCPGLVFPSCVDRSLQVVSGIFPIAQVREPYSTVGYLAQHIDLPLLLHLTHPEMADRPPGSSGKDLKWSPFDICESWAVKHGYFTAKASRPDTYRAANQILRMAVEARIRLCFAPPGFYHSQGKEMKGSTFETVPETDTENEDEGQKPNDSQLDIVPPTDSEEEDFWQGDNFALTLRQRLHAHTLGERLSASDSDTEEQLQPGHHDGDQEDSTGGEEEEDAAFCVDLNPFAMLSDS